MVYITESLNSYTFRKAWEGKITHEGRAPATLCYNDSGGRTLTQDEIDYKDAVLELNEEFSAGQIPTIKDIDFYNNGSPF